MISLALRRDIRRILTHNSSSLSSTILIHGRWAGSIGHYLLVMMIRRRWDFTLKTIVLVSCGNFVLLKGAIVWRWSSYRVCLGYLSRSIRHLLLNCQLLVDARFLRTSVNRGCNIGDWSRNLSTGGCCAANHIQIFETTFNWWRLLMRTHLNLVAHWSTCLRESTMIRWRIKWDVNSWLVGVIIVDTTGMINIFDICGVAFLEWRVVAH